jgi:hypothetical protein
MTPRDAVVATTPGSQLSQKAFLQRLHRRGLLRPLLLEAFTQQLVREEAKRAGLSVSDADLQLACDAYLRGMGLLRAADTPAWLASRGMTGDDLEADVEGRLLTAMLRRHLSAARNDEALAARREGRERLALAVVRADRDDLARELACQVRDDGRGLADVAGDHGLRVIRAAPLRQNLDGPLRDALAPAADGDLVGPVATVDGFVLAVIEQRLPAEPDTAARRDVEDELFDRWLSERLGPVALTADLLGADG